MLHSAVSRTSGTRAPCLDPRASGQVSSSESLRIVSKPQTPFDQEETETDRPLNQSASEYSKKFKYKLYNL